MLAITLRTNLIIDNEEISLTMESPLVIHKSINDEYTIIISNIKIDVDNVKYFKTPILTNSSDSKNKLLLTSRNNKFNTILCDIINNQFSIHYKHIILDIKYKIEDWKLLLVNINIDSNDSRYKSTNTNSQFTLKQYHDDN